MKITWLGHAAFIVDTQGVRFLIDPFLTGNPQFPEGLRAEAEKADVILVTHGHSDHFGDTMALAQKTGAKVVASFEIAHFLTQKKGLNSAQIIGMNVGGAVPIHGQTVHMVQAIHSNSLLDGDALVYAGYPSGFVLEGPEACLYHAGDTALFSDMQLIQRFYNPTIGLLPIGGHYTMTARAAAYACNELMALNTIVPMHYDTFPVIATDAHVFKSMVTRGQVKILTPAQSLEV